MTPVVQHNVGDAGFFLGTDGVPVASGQAALLRMRWRNYLQNLLQPFYETEFAVSHMISREALERSGYIKNFPHQIVNCVDDGGRGTHCLAPAACLHLYPLLQDSVLDRNEFSALVYGPCTRRENGHFKPPFRLQAFDMMELVVLGTDSQVTIVRDELLSVIHTAMSELGMFGRTEDAVDAFYLDSGRGAQLMQKILGLKKEYRVHIGDESVAVASVNLHEDFFGRSFNIKLPGGRPAYSMCAAFGIDRLTVGGLMQWGPLSNWPSVLGS